MAMLHLPKSLIYTVGEKPQQEKKDEERQKYLRWHLLLVYFSSGVLIELLL